MDEISLVQMETNALKELNGLPFTSHAKITCRPTIFLDNHVSLTERSARGSYRQTYRHNKDIQTEAQTYKQKHRHTDRDRDIQTETQTYKQKPRHTDRNRDIQTETESYRQRQRHTDINRNIQT